MKNFIRRIINKLKGEIKVVIPAQKYSIYTYGNVYDCYLARELKKLGYKNISIGENGKTAIGRSYYKPKELFNAGVVQDAFEIGDSISVTLIKA